MISEYRLVLYIAVNGVNGKRYIGITNTGLRKREQRHRHTANSGLGAVFGAALRKHGNAIEFRVLAVCPSLDFAKAMEIAAIAKYLPEYNLTLGGDGCSGYRHSAAHKKHVGALQRGNKHWLGKTHSKDTRLKMARARSRYWSLTPHSRKQPPSKEPQIIAIRGAVLVGKQIECLSTGEVFNSIIAASRHTGCDRKSIRLVCNGIHHTAGGLAFKYLGSAA